MKIRSIAATLLAALVAIAASLVAVVAFAQGEPATAATSPVMTASTEQALVALINAVGTAVVIFALKVGMPRMLPKNILPLLAPVIGVAGEALLQAATGVGIGPVYGALLGSAGVGIREGMDQARQEWVTVATARDGS